MEEGTMVTVRNPQTHSKFNKLLYTDYEITVQSRSSAFRLPLSSVRRRYSEFVWLRERLERTGREVSELPHKTLFRRFEAPFLEARCDGLESFLQAIMKTKVFLADRGVHLFVQSRLTTDQIEGVLSGDYKYVESPSTRCEGGRTSSTAETDEESSTDESDESDPAES